MWKRILFDGCDYLFQHRLDETSGDYLILLTDLKVLYSQRLGLEEFAQDFQRLNKDLEVDSYQEVLGSMFQILDEWAVGHKQSAARLCHKIKG